MYFPFHSVTCVLTTHPQVVHQSEVCGSPSISASFGVNQDLANLTLVSLVARSVDF